MTSKVDEVGRKVVNDYTIEANPAIGKNPEEWVATKVSLDGQLIGKSGFKSEAEASKWAIQQR